MGKPPRVFRRASEMLRPLFLVVLLTLRSAAAAEACRDIHPHCSLFKGLGLCAIASQAAIYKYNCAVSCSFCGKSAGPCLDRLQSCASYKSQGFCTTDEPLRAEYACPVTCNLCNSPV
ncbi:unnamed protein product [Caenorhabditis auriculariae]|uniref:ShKT domain-containing protein n=1 Tax=Caenorhabditis auriculariae TaxID=2777116 RepID=A0A8S1HGF1_9PELO|nr:unnamed protein product [Caenorhabditis auriculariae]